MNQQKFSFRLDAAYPQIPSVAAVRIALVDLGANISGMQSGVSESDKRNYEFCTTTTITFVQNAQACARRVLQYLRPNELKVMVRERPSALDRRITIALVRLCSALGPDDFRLQLKKTLGAVNPWDEHQVDQLLKELLPRPDPIC